MVMPEARPTWLGSSFWPRATEGLKATRNGLLQTDEQGETTVEGIFASGDVVLGAKTVVEAVAYSKTVAEAMDAYMKEKAGKEKNEKDGKGLAGRE